MDLRFLESLIAVVKHGSIAAAARQQGLTATAVSQRIRALEADLGQDLLLRSAHKAQPTGACLRLLPRANQLLQEERFLRADMDPDGLSGPLRLGAIETAMADYIPGVIPELAKHAPKADLTVFPGPSVTHYQRVLDQEIDGAFMIAPPFCLPKMLEAQTIVRQPLALIAQADKGDDVARLIADGPLILYDRASWGGALAGRWLAKQNSAAKILCELDSLETIALLAQQGLGIAIVPVWCSLQREKLKQIVVAQEGFYREIIFLNHRLSPRKALLDVVRRLNPPV